MGCFCFVLQNSFPLNLVQNFKIWIIFHKNILTESLSITDCTGKFLKNKAKNVIIGGEIFNWHNYNISGRTAKLGTLTLVLGFLHLLSYFQFSISISAFFFFFAFQNWIFRDFFLAPFFVFFSAMQLIILNFVVFFCALEKIVFKWQKKREWNLQIIVLQNLTPF